MSCEGKCYFCSNHFWTEKIVICLDCLREMESYKRADFIFIIKGEYHSTLSGSDPKHNLEFLEKFIIPNLKKKLNKKELAAAEKEAKK